MRAFLAAFVAVKEALVFIYTWIVCVCQLQNINCRNYENKKVNFPITCCSVAILSN